MDPSSTDFTSDATDWRVADLVGRAAAAFLDFVVVSVLLLPVLLAVRAFEELAGYDVPYEVLFGAVPYVVSLVYLGLTEGRRGARNGQTWAKQFADIRTVRAATGEPITRRQAWVRGAWIALLLPMGFPGYLLVEWATDDALNGRVHGAIVNLGVLLALLVASLLPTRRTYYDLAAGTAVLAHDEHPRDGRERARSASPGRASAPRPAGAISFATTPLNRNEYLSAGAWSAWIVLYVFLGGSG